MPIIQSYSNNNHPAPSGRSEPEWTDIESYETEQDDSDYFDEESDIDDLEIVFADSDNETTSKPTIRIMPVMFIQRA